MCFTRCPTITISRARALVEWPWLVGGGHSTMAKKKEYLSTTTSPRGETEVCVATVSIPGEFVIPVEHYSTFTRVQRIVAWILLSLSNCRPVKRLVPDTSNLFLSVSELIVVEQYLVRSSQVAHFAEDISSLQAGKDLLHGSNLLSLCPFVDPDRVLHVGCRESHSTLAYS